MHKKKIGIMGGTFDPLHNAHLLLAEHSRVEFELDEILFIPAGNPPHKDPKKISYTNHRYEMTLLATNSNPYFYASSIEIERDDTTYTVDTVESLSKQYKDSELYFILGADSFCNIHTWKDHEKLLGLCNMIVAKRLDTDNDSLDKKLRELSDKYSESIYVLESPLIEISSTNIRKRVKDGLSIKYLVPDLVEFYIEKNKLYR